MFRNFSFDSAAQAFQDSPRLVWLRELMQLPQQHPKVCAVRRRLAVAWYIAAFALLAWGAAIRFALPLEPLLDRDIEGYLGPAISALGGRHFVHMFGRGFPYPAFIYAILRVFGDFRAIAVIQHLLGVAAGLLILLAWNAAGRLVPSGGFPKTVYPFFGFVPSFTYLGSQRMIVFEHQIRPEAIFPFLSILTIWISFLFLDARFIRPKRPVALCLGALNVFLACLLYEIKPSFGFAVILCTLPVWLSLFAPGVAPRRIALLAAAILPAFFLILLPEHFLKKSDGIATTFLPETLLTIHAQIIERQLTEDLAGTGALPYPRPFIQSAHDLLKAELQIASHMVTPRPYTTLGTNPDYLMYEHSFCTNFVAVNHLSRQQMANFCFTYYGRALLHHPLAMALKILRQLGIVYQFRCPIYWQGHKTDLSGDFYAHATQLTRHIGAIAPHLTLLASYVEECNRLARQNISVVQSNGFDLWMHILSIQYLILFIIALAAPFFLFRTYEMRSHFFWLIAAIWLAGSYNLGNCLTIAVVHTLEVARYVHLQLIFAVFFQCLAFYFLLELAALRFRSCFRTKSEPSRSTSGN